MAYSKHLSDIRSGVISKTNIIGIRKALNNFERSERGYSTSRTCSLWTRSEVNELLAALKTSPPLANGELTLVGIDQLTNKRYAKRWTESELSIINDIDTFRLVGFTGYSGNTPIWRVKGCNGLTFDYINKSWQSGGDGPQVY